jgi:thiamine-phosphate pyrophosphorylase
MTREKAAAIGLDVFYPIVPDIAWLKRLLPLGIRTVQIRIKDERGEAVKAQIAEAMTECKAAGCQLIVNDYWEIALELGADFIHLGQEDLAEADVQRIKAAGCRLGVSTHDEAERDIALGVIPDYVALGPIYETKLKVMKWAPQGLERVGQWKKAIGDLPLVGIAGITVERAQGVIDAGADACAVITDFITHENPEARVAEWLAWAEMAR